MYHLDYRRYQHGNYKSKLTSVYNAWSSMKARCDNPNHHAFHRYGGRGITYCERWADFDAFFEDMGHPPKDKPELNRLDNDGNYEPSNCEWSDVTAQSRNRHTNHLITHEGRTQCLQAWADETGISRYIIARKLKKGLPMHEVFALN